MIVVSDSSCLIGITRIGHLDILKRLFGEIYIPLAVYNEVVEKEKLQKEVDEIKKATWIKSQDIQDRLASQILELSLGKGEAETIILGKKLCADYVILNERMARQIASQMGIKVIGLLGILVKAKEKKIITQIKPLIEALMREKFRIDKDLVEMALKKDEE